MSLNYDITKIDNAATVCWESAPAVEGGKRMVSDLHVIIFGTMVVDLGVIRESNLAEWRWRVEYAKLSGCPIGSKKGEPWVPDLATLRSFIGLSTNVADKSRAVWVKKMKDWTHREREREVNELLRTEA